MEKKKSSVKQQPKNTADIRSFFNRPVSASTTNGTKSNENKLINKNNSSIVLSSSSDDSPIKKTNKFTNLKAKEVDKMPPKRKKIDYFESDESDEEVIRVSKKSKKSEVKPKKETKSKRSKIESDSEYSASEDEFVPLKEKSNKKSSPPAKKAKSTAKTTAKTGSKTTAKTTGQSKSKSTKGTKTKENKSSSARVGKSKIVKPLDHESSDDDNRIDCTMVAKNTNILSGFGMQNQSSKIVSDSKKKSTSQLGEMWVDKYKPIKTTDIIGQHTAKSCANKLKNWLDNWFKYKDEKPNHNSQKETGIGLKAALLSGCPGIGKTTTAQLVAKECGFDFVEYNASDTRNKKSMDENIQTLIGNKTLSGFFQDPTHQTQMSTRHLVIMDEVDGMAGNADRGGIAELIQFIKKTNIPIICICNDRGSNKIRNLANYCFDLRFSRPRAEQIKKMILGICAKEGLKVNDNLLLEIIEMSNHDIRQVIHYLSVFATKTKNLNDVKDNKLIKNVVLGPFDAVKKMFTAGKEYDQMTFKEKSDLFFNDYQLMPLMAWENYIQCKPTKSSSASETLAMACKSADAFCIGDMLETQIRTKQNWSLLPYQAVFSTVMPGFYMNGHFGGMIQFPGWLGKLSSTNKKDRLVSELKQHMNLKITGNKTCLNLDYILPLREKILKPILNEGIDGIEDSIETLNYYCLLKDDLDPIIELSLWAGEKSPFLKVETKVKSAFTRSFNKLNNPLPYSDKDQIKKLGKDAGKGKKKGIKSDEEDEEEEESKDEELLPEF